MRPIAIFKNSVSWPANLLTLRSYFGPIMLTEAIVLSRREMAALPPLPYFGAIASPLDATAGLVRYERIIRLPSFLGPALD
jgi:hypothetical protein